MVPVLIGLSSGLLIITVFVMLIHFEKRMIYGLILSGIGFLYVGFVWTDIRALVQNSIQAVIFVLLAYYGMKKSVFILAAGYFLHGSWDIAYGLFNEPGLIPPHYDLFCSSLDFTIGIYIVFFSKKFSASRIS